VRIQHGANRFQPDDGAATFTGDAPDPGNSGYMHKNAYLEHSTFHKLTGDASASFASRLPASSTPDTLDTQSVARRIAWFFCKTATVVNSGVVVKLS
jgi:hypothetical protein